MDDSDRLEEEVGDDSSAYNVNDDEVEDFLDDMDNDGLNDDDEDRDALDLTADNFCINCNIMLTADEVVTCNDCLGEMDDDDEVRDSRRWFV